MGRRPASTDGELRLVDALPHLPAREVADLIWGDAGLRDRVLRRRRSRREARARFAVEHPELAALLRELD
jgi:hypothetical protein